MEQYQKTLHQLDNIPLIQEVEVRIEKIHPDAVLPLKGTELRAYYDVYSVEDVELTPEKVFMVHTGLRVQPPVGYFIDIRPRSGLAKEGITINNSPGTLDCDYGGELIVELIWHTPIQMESDWLHPSIHDGSLDTPGLLEIRNIPEYHINKGDRIAQISVMPMYLIKFVGSRVDGTAGFGSTGR
jgi:dUTP pyrophosphatase